MSSERAEKLKAIRNLDDDASKAETSNSFFLNNFSVDDLLSKVNNMGVLVENNSSVVLNDLRNNDHLVSNQIVGNQNIDSTDIEISNDLGEEDHFILNKLCSDIMEEVMDSGTDHICEFKVNSETKKTSLKKKNKSRVSKNPIVSK